MTQSLKQTAVLTLSKMKYAYDKEGVIAELIGTAKIKETSTLVLFRWTTSKSASTLVILNEVCVDNHFKKALRNILLGYVSGILHRTEVGYSYRTSENGQLEE